MLHWLVVHAAMPCHAGPVLIPQTGTTGAKWPPSYSGRLEPALTSVTAA